MIFLITLIFVVTLVMILLKFYFKRVYYFEVGENYRSVRVWRRSCRMGLFFYPLLLVLSFPFILQEDVGYFISYVMSSWQWSLMSGGVAGMCTLIWLRLFFHSFYRSHWRAADEIIGVRNKQASSAESVDNFRLG